MAKVLTLRASCGLAWLSAVSSHQGHEELTTSLSGGLGWSSLHLWDLPLLEEKLPLHALRLVPVSVGNMEAVSTCFLKCVLSFHAAGG